MPNTCRRNARRPRLRRFSLQCICIVARLSRNSSGCCIPRAERKAAHWHDPRRSPTNSGRLRVGGPILAGRWLAPSPRGTAVGRCSDGAVLRGPNAQRWSARCSVTDAAERGRRQRHPPFQESATVAGLLKPRGEVRLRWAGHFCPGASQSPSWSGSGHVAGGARIANVELIVRLCWPLSLAVAVSS
jgi:hypothetical protein